MGLLDKINRVLANPTHYFDHYYQRYSDEYFSRRDLAYFDSLKDKYKGRRGFVIGNGPSLKVEDLDRIKNEISIASNKIYMCYDIVDWRPTIYTITDDLLWPKLAPEIHHYEREVFIQSKLKRLDSCKARVYTANYLGLADHSPADGSKYSFSSNISQGIYGGHTVTYDNLQWASHLGLESIYLMGCDHYYQEEVQAETYTPISAGKNTNHFMSGYRSPDEIVNPAYLKEMTKAYKVAKKYGDEHGIKIYNATRGGHLEVFPRVIFDDLF
jgi:hypothetical protein